MEVVSRSWLEAEIQKRWRCEGFHTNLHVPWVPTDSVGKDNSPKPQKPKKEQTKYPAIAEFVRYSERNYYINGKFQPGLWNFFEQSMDNRNPH